MYPECQECPYGRVIYDENGSDFDCTKESCLYHEEEIIEIDIDDDSLPF